MRTAALGSAARRHLPTSSEKQHGVPPTRPSHCPPSLHGYQGDAAGRATGPHHTKAGWSNRHTAYTHERRPRSSHPRPPFTPLPASTSPAPPAAAQPNLLPGCSATALQRRRGNGQRTRARRRLTSASGPQPRTPLGHTPTSRGWKRAQRLAPPAQPPFAP